jgi:hypothetical protein
MTSRVLLAVAFLSPASAQPRFIDVASRSSFAYVTNNGFTGRKYFPQPLCGGVAAFDFDNDGYADVYLTNGASFPALKKTDASFHNTLLRNRRDGTFEDVTARAGLAGEHLGYSLGAAAADYDGDGFTDLFVANAGANTLYRNNGDGTFTDVSASSGLGTKPSGTLSVQGAWLDFDNDGRLDLGPLQLHPLDCGNRHSMRARGQGRFLLPSEDIPAGSSSSVPQCGTGKVLRRHRFVRIRQRARQGNGDRDRRRQWGRMDGRLHRQRYRAKFSLRQSEERNLQRTGIDLRRRL